MLTPLEQKDTFLCRQAQKCAFLRRGKSKEGVRGRVSDARAPVGLATERAVPALLAGGHCFGRQAAGAWRSHKRRTPSLKRCVSNAQEKSADPRNARVCTVVHW